MINWLIIYSFDGIDLIIYWSIDIVDRDSKFEVVVASFLQDYKLIFEFFMSYESLF